MVEHNGEVKDKPAVKKREQANPDSQAASKGLLTAIILVPILLVVFFIGVYAYWGSGPVIAEVPWFTPMFSTFVALTALSVAFLALGRYQVQCDPISYWVSLTFAAFGVGLVFYVLVWPDLLPGGRSFIASLTNTPAWISSFSVTLPAPLLFAAALLRWPAGKILTARRAQLSMIAWILVVALFFALLIVFERYLPVLVNEDDTYTPALTLWNGAVVLLQTAGVALSVRRYRLSGDRLIGSVTFFQIAMVFAPLLIIAGGQRYDLWWYLSRVVLVSGCLTVLYGLFSEYVHLYWRVRNSEARYRQLTESLPQLIWATDASGCCNFVSPQWVAYTGVAEEHNLGDGWLNQVHADERQEVIGLWAEAVSTGRQFEIECRLRRHDGTFRWFKTLGLPIRDSHHQIAQWFGSCTDVDDLKQVEADLRDFTRRLERSNRDLQDFAYVASHDLQEPLRKVELFGDAILEEAGNLTEQQSQYLARMRSAAARMRAMVHGLLLLSRLEIQAQPFEPVDLGQTAAEVLSDLEIQVRRSRAEVEVCDLPVIDADPQQMRQLFLNLISNALKFRPPGQAPRIKISARSLAPDAVQIQVEDNGIGFDPQFAGQLFEPFRRLVGVSEYEGSGMGLAICRKIIERHFGEIRAESQPGQGATFLVTLPIHQKRSFNMTIEEPRD